MTLRLITYLAPSIPEELFRRGAERLDASLELVTRISGPLEGDDDPFADGRADVGFVCAPTYRWMRAGWGFLGPLALFPMVWGTVRIRSTMAATGILYVDVVAVIIGEVLGGWLSALSHLPL